MNQLKRELPRIEDRWISIHDMHITQICCEDNSVIFYFGEGFNLIEDGQVYRKTKGYIKLSGCNSSDFSCNIIKRRPTARGARLIGRPVSLEEINQILIDKNKFIEIYIELYDSNHLHWRGELLPLKKRFNNKLAPTITIDAMDFYPMVYLWE